MLRPSLRNPRTEILAAKTLSFRPENRKQRAMRRIPALSCANIQLFPLKWYQRPSRSLCSTAVCLRKALHERPAWLVSPEKQDSQRSSGESVRTRHGDERTRDRRRTVNTSNWSNGRNHELPAFTPASHEKNTIRPYPFLCEETEPLKEELVPRLAHGLDSVLFESEPQFLKDPSTGAYNFDPWLKNICQPEDFDYDVLPAYMIASEDKALLDAARKHDKKYVSSTSSFTGILAKMYLLISQHKPIDKSSFSASFETQPSFLTSSSRAPTSIILRHVNGTYAIDSEKTNKEWNILQILGKSMEKMLTAAPEEFDLCRKENSHKLTEEMKDKDYHRFAKVEQFLLRAQIDCYHPDLPHKTFDLKTRATLAIRMNPATCKENLDYKLNLLRGDILSFEREDFDMLRSAMLKYSFQVRIGGMDGVFVCYHNTDEVFGFQYLPLTKMDQQLFGNSLFGQQAFALSVKVCQMVFDRVTKDFPGQSLRITIGQQKPTFQFEPLAILVDPITELNTAFDSPPSPNLTQYDLSCISRINRSYVTPTITSPADEWSLDCTFHKANVSRGSLLRTYKYMRENAANLGLQENNTNERFINEVREMAGLPKHQRQSTITASPEGEKLRD